MSTNRKQIQTVFVEGNVGWLCSNKVKHLCVFSRMQLFAYFTVAFLIYVGDHKGSSMMNQKRGEISHLDINSYHLCCAASFNLDALFQNPRLSLPFYSCLYSTLFCSKNWTMTRYMNFASASYIHYILSKAFHPNYIRIYGKMFFEPDFPGQKAHIYLIQKLLRNTSISFFETI